MYSKIFRSVFIFIIFQFTWQSMCWFDAVISNCFTVYIFDLFESQEMHFVHILFKSQQIRKLLFEITKSKNKTKKCSLFSLLSLYRHPFCYVCAINVLKYVRLYHFTSQWTHLQQFTFFFFLLLFFVELFLYIVTRAFKGQQNDSLNSQFAHLFAAVCRYFVFMYMNGRKNCIFLICSLTPDKIYLIYEDVVVHFIFLIFLLAKLNFHPLSW